MGVALKSTNFIKMGDELDEDFEVEEVLDTKCINGVRYYLLKWIGYSDEFNTWEPEANLNCETLINDYLAKIGETQIEKILGANQKNGELSLVVQYQNGLKRLIPMPQAYQKFPSLVINFFEERLHWKHESNSDKMQSLTEDVVKKMRLKTGDFRGGFRQNYKPEAICGIINSMEGLLVLIKWDGHDLVELVPAHEVHKNCPEMLLNYYNDRIEWVDEPKACPFIDP